MGKTKPGFWIKEQRAEKKKKTPGVNTLRLQWADQLGHWVQLYQPISNSSPSDKNGQVPQTKSRLIITHVEFKLTRNNSLLRVPGGTNQSLSQKPTSVVD